MAKTKVSLRWSIVSIIKCIVLVLCVISVSVIRHCLTPLVSDDKSLLSGEISIFHQKKIKNQKILYCFLFTEFLGKNTQHTKRNWTPEILHSVVIHISVSSPDQLHNTRARPGLTLGLHPANERRHYKVTPSLTGRAQSQNQPSRLHSTKIYKYNNWCKASKLIAPALTTIWSQIFKMGSWKKKKQQCKIAYCVISVLLLS